MPNPRGHTFCKKNLMPSLRGHTFVLGHLSCLLVKAPPAVVSWDSPPCVPGWSFAVGCWALPHIGHFIGNLESLIRLAVCEGSISESVANSQLELRPTPSRCKLSRTWPYADLNVNYPQIHLPSRRVAWVATENLDTKVHPFPDLPHFTTTRWPHRAKHVRSTAASPFMWIQVSVGGTTVEGGKRETVETWGRRRCEMVAAMIMMSLLGGVYSSWAVSSWVQI
jgi:hypothetical protein